MAKYEVTIAQLRSVKGELESYNGEFRNKVKELEKKQQALKGMWQGDANNAFDVVFNEDKSKWEQFANLMDQYIGALEKIAARYEQAEATNVETAKQRKY